MSRAFCGLDKRDFRVAVSPKLLITYILSLPLSPPLLVWKEISNNMRQEKNLSLKVKLYFFQLLHTA